MIRREAVQAAAFWNLNICLACGATGEEGEDAALALAECPECGEEAVFHAPAFEKGLGLVLGEDEE